MVTATVVSTHVPFAGTFFDRLVAERPLATRKARTADEARAWFDRNADSFRMSLDEHETGLECRVHDSRGRVVMRMSTGRELGDEIEVEVVETRRRKRR